MKKINFNTKKTNFYSCFIFSEDNNFPHSETLKQAADKDILKDINKNFLFKFIEFLEEKKNISSQLYQDMFAEFIIGNNFKRNFLEFGATNGLDLSNSYSLEKFFNWEGVLAEPDPQWHDELKKNRPNTKIIFDCIWKKSNEKINFLSSKKGVYSTIDSFKFNDKDSMPGNSNARNQDSKNIILNTISLNDLIKQNFNDQAPSYISIDTEGSEYEILSSLDFKKYRPKVFTIEHNYTNYEKKIDDLMILNGFIRVFNKLTIFDAWYVDGEVIDKFK